MTAYSVDDPTAALLQRYGFEDIPLESLQKRLHEGRAGGDHNQIVGLVEPPQEGDLRPLPALGSDARALLEERGLEAIRTGEVGVVILAGGMATRFGGAVKAAVEAIDGKSFLALKLEDVKAVAQRAGARVPVYLMSSFATDEALQRLAGPFDDEHCTVSIFPQFISLRLTESGEVFHDSAGAVSLYAPGHGDLTFALRRSGVLTRFREAGGKVLFMSNVDNLTATLDPAVIGAHLESGAALTAEMAPKEPGDKGGAPARVDGSPQIVEAFRFPTDFDQDRIPVFNTNTFVLSAEAIDRDFPLSWFAVRKEVDGQTVIQFERLVGELTAFLRTSFLRVERHGPDARFQPIKTPDDMEKQRTPILEALEARGSLRPSS